MEEIKITKKTVIYGGNDNSDMCIVCPKCKAVRRISGIWERNFKESQNKLYWTWSCLCCGKSRIKYTGNNIKSIPQMKTKW